MLENFGQFIGGRALKGEEAGEVAFNPATGEELVNLASASREQVDAAVLAARQAYPVWSRITPRERAKRMIRIAARIEQHEYGYASWRERGIQNVSVQGSAGHLRKQT